MERDEAMEVLLRLSELCGGCVNAHHVAVRMVTTEETAAWEALGEVLVPSFDRAVLDAAARVVAFDVDAVWRDRDQAREALQAASRELKGQLLTDAAFHNVDATRGSATAAADAARDRLKSLRAGTLKADAREHDRLQQQLAAAEADAARAAGLVARHRKARTRLTDVEEQLRRVDDDAVRRTRLLVVNQLLPVADTFAPLHDADGVVQAWVHRLRGIRAKRRRIDELAQPVVPLVEQLNALRRDSDADSYKATVVVPQQVEALRPSAERALHQHRTSLAAVVAFDAYSDVEAGADTARWHRAFAGEAITAASPAPSSSSTNAAFAPSPEPYLSEEPAQTMTGTSRFLSSTGAFDFALAPPQTPASTPLTPAAPPPSTSTTFQLAEGTQVGRYRIKGLIGRGGMAEVYLAEQLGHAGFTKRVVLKRIAAGIRGDPDAARMFAREAQLAGALHHPHLVQVYDYQAVDDDVFIVMEHLEGLSLLKLGMRLHALGKRIPVPVVLRFLADAARGLHAAHAWVDDDGKHVGLIHRDISPDNLFLTTSGITKVLDFGIAKRHDLTTLTGKNTLRGKIPYMSPEHIQNEPLDARADLFSLGATLYWLLVGQQPFGGTNEVMTLHAVLTKQPPPIFAQRDDVPAAVVDLVMALLHKRREERPASASVVAQRCDELGASSPERAADQLHELGVAQ